MSLYEIILIGIGLAMDAFAVSVCKGLSINKVKSKVAIIIALYFGIFQAIMPILGYYIGKTFTNFLLFIDHWIVLIILTLIGGNMIKESLHNESQNFDNGINVKSMLLLSIATSIDAFTVGITFSLFKINVFYAGIIIGLITFTLSFIGVKIGNKFGEKLQKKAEFVGGIILIIMGIRILLEHLGII